MNLPTVKQLRYFIALEKKVHFGRAAEACFVSQSAFSVAIRELETILKVQLVDRTNKRVTITAQGRDIAKQARLCLRNIEALVNIAHSHQEPLSGRLSLGVIPTIAPFLLPSVLPHLRQHYPQLNLFLREDMTRRLYQRLMLGELDLMLIALPYKLKDVVIMPLFKDPFYLACREDTQWIDPYTYDFKQLSDESILLLEDGHCLRDHALVACQISNHDTIRPFSASSLLTLIEMVDADLGVSYLTEMARTSSLLLSTQVKMWPLPMANSDREIALAWRQGSARDEEFHLLGEAIRQVQLAQS